MPDFHATYGGSNSDIWSNCHGAPGLWAQVPKRPAGPAAVRGSALHACMERLIGEEGLTTKQFLGVTIMGYTVELPDVEALDIALNAYDDIVANYSEKALILSERFVTLLLDPEGGAPISGGSMDVGIADGERGAIADFKFGGEEVEATGTQNLFYATAARRSLPEFARIKEWDCYIIQPAFDPAIDKVTFPVTVLDRAEQEFLTAIKLSKAPNPPFLEGEWCKWCPAKLVCPPKVNRLATLTAPNHILDLDDLGEQLVRLRSWDKWREEAEERLHHELEHGTPIKGWKLVAKRAVRQWVDEAAAILKFKTLKISSTQYMVTKLISPAQAEKILPKAEVNKLANPVSSGTTIAPMEDKRPAVLAPAALGEALRKVAGG